jgi:signal-transduction protein with cAMP-binding, CBS, and nucleotidyltransferase domain
MRWMNVLKRRVRALFRHGAVEADMRDELRLHFEMAVETGMREGMSRAEAERRAKVHFGGVERVKE